MEFHEKLQELRKSRGLTQEELAQALYVSRTAVSKWESGRGYPSIDSLKEISGYFSVSVDNLLSGEKLLSIAEKENQSNICSICELLFGIVDVCSFLLMMLPLYPNMADGFIYSVNLFSYVQATSLQRTVYGVLFAMLILAGITKLLLRQLKMDKYAKKISGLSVLLGVFTVLVLAMAREAYAIAVSFVLLVIKVILLFCEMRAVS